MDKIKNQQHRNEGRLLTLPTSPQCLAVVRIDDCRLKETENQQIVSN
jgi:hypothetical protein